MALMMPTNMWAALAVGDWFKADGMEFKVISLSPNEVQVGIGTRCAIDKQTEGVVSIPSLVKDSDGNSYSVTSIGNYAFEDCINVTEITIPEGVISIGMAFWRCSNLKSINIPRSTTSISTSAFQSSPLSEVHISDVAAFCQINFGGGGSNPLSIPGAHLFVNGKETTDLIIPEGVTSICKHAFWKCNSLTSVTIPNGVSIGMYAFYQCEGLTSVTCASSIHGERVFSQCPNLTTVTLLDSVKEIGEYIFLECDALTSVYVDLKSWCSINANGNVGDFYDKLYFDNIKATEIVDLVIPEGITKLSNGVFRGMANLKSVTFPSSMTDFSTSNFYDCNALSAINIQDLNVWLNTTDFSFGTNPLKKAKHLFVKGKEVKDLVIPEGISAINDYVFYGCEGLTSVTIPQSVTSIGTSAFEGCTGLTAVHLSDIAAWCRIPFRKNDNGDNPLKKAGHLFMNGNEVTELVIPEGVTSISYGAFSGCKFNSISIPSSLTSISEYAFQGANTVYIKDLAAWCKIKLEGSSGNPMNNCEHLFINGEEVTDLVIPDGVASISDYAFYGCKPLTSVNTGNTVKEIGSRSFVACDNLKNVTLGSSVTNIGERAFYHCKELKEVYSYIEEPFDITDPYMFTVYDSDKKDFYWPDRTLYVPIGTKALYEATDGWKVFKTIVEMGTTELEPIEAETTVNTNNLAGQSLSDNVVDDVYYNVGDGGYDASDGSIVIGETTNMSQITDATPGSSDIANNFTGLILKVAAGKGTIKVNVKTTGNAQLVVQIGNQTPMIATKTEQGDVIVSYDVTKDTYVYIYAIVGSSSARSLRAAPADAVKIYSITVTPGATVISTIQSSQPAVDSYYTLDGRKVQGRPAKKGVYVVNGRKVVIK